jgi:ubiquinone/menaquinone biosynthesis C-methylase UbiE
VKIEGSNKETRRIIQAYEKRKESVPSQRYSYFNEGSCFISQRMEWEMLKLLKKQNINSLLEIKILDVGCGAGGVLRNFMRYGAQPENLYGIDLLPDRINLAKRLSPNINFKCGNASRLPYENQTFDIVIQFTVFTSVLDSTMKNKISKEMLRVLKTGGSILWYDFHVNNPDNPDVKGVNKKEINDLFDSCEIHLKRVTLAPPLARAVVRYSYIFCNILENLKILNTHYIGVIKKKA